MRTDVGDMNVPEKGARKHLEEKIFRRQDSSIDAPVRANIRTGDVASSLLETVGFPSLSVCQH
ncbi:unnamed protein product [Prunus armeniaca]|uniref:Uncharacterized protein n=1 Tax=Prunus armeniaca TaxID=36596 RepID=A0A6J5VEW5_PRUAR|nr:unnamed protein product [Prunus armeniaca]CAB4317170.1 unnamed protein product [Prunus armeniaca]